MLSLQRRALRRMLVILDGVSIVAAMIVAMATHSVLRRHFPGFEDPPALELYVLLAYLTLPLWLSVAAVLGLYRQLERPISTWQLLRDLTRLHVFGLLGLTLVIYLTQIYMNRSVVALFLVITFVLMFASRVGLQGWLRIENRRGHGQQRVLLVADTAETVRIVADMALARPLPPHLVGILAHDAWPFDSMGTTLPILGNPNSIRQVLHDNVVDLVLVSCSRDVAVDIDDLLEACDDIGVPLHCHIRVDSGGDHIVRVTDEIGIPAITFDTKQRSADALLAKRALDIAVSTIGIVTMSPVILAVAIAILMSMGRPVLLRQERSGYNGRTFTMYKFRTMVLDAAERKAELEAFNEIEGPAFKMRLDPRITPLGRFLRRSSADELPQLFNVLVGRMSLVGPRPLLVGEQQRISGPQRRRLSMKPGMTGPWQVSGRSDLGFEEWMRLDLEYVDNWSLELDLRLLLRTIPAVLTGRGAR